MISAVTCPIPAEEFNNTHMVFRPSPSGPVMYGTSINVSCSHGFPQQGSRVMTCQLDNVTNTARWEWPGDRLAMRPNCVGQLDLTGTVMENRMNIFSC